MAFGSGNNSNKPGSSHHHHHHHHNHQSSSNSSHQQLGGGSTSSSSLQQQKCNSSSSGGSTAAPPHGFSGAAGYYDRDISTNSGNVYQNHMFFQQTTSFKNQKQTFNPTGSTTGLLANEFADAAGDTFFSQQYNQNNPFTNLHSNRDLTPSERALLDQIRARKSELLKEIAQLQNEIDSVSRELVFKEDPPDLLNHQHHPPLADVELDNLSEHSNNNDEIGGKIPSTSLLGSNSSTSSSKEKDRLKMMSLGCKKFNMDPKKGIEFLVLNALLKKDDEQDIAMFLYRGEGLNKTAIGDYLGEKSDFNERVLKSFVALHDFTDLILVQALRQFLWSFRLPGEAQKIDRMMECFAQRYCQNNPDIFTNTDTCYVLSFAIIMLNTSLHNPSVKDKPTVDTFISMNRGINNGGDLPRELLISLYNSIQSEPFKIPEDDGNDLMHTFFNPDKEGWLWKQGGRYKTWKRRWFILNDNCLYYFEFTTDKEPRGIIPLENVGVREIEDSKSKQKYCFELYATDGSEVIKACKTDSDGRVVEGKHSVYRMSAASSEERDSWVKALRQSISYSPFYEILRKSGAAGNSTSSLRAGFGAKT